MSSDKPNPYQPPSAIASDASDPTDETPGLDRVSFAVSLVAAIVIPGSLLRAVFPTIGTGALDFGVVPLLIFPLWIGLLAWITGQRCKNIGWNNSIGFLIAVPFVNMGILLACLVLPADFSKKKRVKETG